MPKTHIASVTISLPAEPSERRMLGDWQPASRIAAAMTTAAARPAAAYRGRAVRRLWLAAPRHPSPWSRAGVRAPAPAYLPTNHRRYGNDRRSRVNWRGAAGTPTRMASMDYVRAAQPRIVALFLVTVLAAMLLCGGPAVWRVLAVLAATALTVGGAATLNNVIERDVDRRMERTRRRPTASGRISPARATLAGLAGVAAGAAALWAVAGGLAAVFALLGAFYYVVLYTLLLKPRTALSAVPGGVAGVFPALIGWAATGAAWSRRDPVPLRADPGLVAAALLGADAGARATTTAPPASPRRPPATATPSRGGSSPGSWRRSPWCWPCRSAPACSAPCTRPAWSSRSSCSGRSRLRLLGRPSTAAAWALFKVTGPCLALVLAAAVIDQLA